MGSTSSEEWHNAVDVKNELRRMLGGILPSAPKGRSRKEAVLNGLARDPMARGIVKDALVGRGHRYWAAWQRGDGTVTVFHALIQSFTDRKRRETYRHEYGSWAKYGLEWGYKDMTEEMGPCEVDCPLSILALATTPAPNNHAHIWREKVRQYWKARAEHRARMADIRIGDILHLRQGFRPNRLTVSRLSGQKVYGSDDACCQWRVRRTHIDRIERATT